MYEIKKYDYLDHLRWIAIIGVIFTHLHYLNLSIWNNSILDQIFKIWWMWVPLFFIVSAYTISLSFNSRLKKEQNPYINFYIRRFFRIYPLFFLINIFVFYLFTYLIVKHDLLFNFDTNIDNLLTHLFFLFWIIPKYISSMYLWEWSLFNELFFYLLFPILYYVTKSKNKLIVFIVVTFLISYLWNIFTKTYNLFDIYWTPLTHLFSFSIWLFLFKIKDIEVSFKNIKKLKILNITFFIILSFLYVKNWYLYIFPFFILNLWLLVFLFVKNWYFFQNIFFNNILKFLWIISYSIYLINLWFYHLLWIYFNSFITKIYWYNYYYEFIFLLLTLTLLIFISFLSYKFLEQPWIKIWKLLINKYSK